MLLGAPGAGRSSLLAAVDGSLRDAGVDVLSGRAVPSPGGSIYTALYDALLDPASQVVLSPTAHSVLRQTVATPERSGNVDLTVSRGERVAAAFARHGRNRPLLVVVDDVDVGTEPARDHLVDLIERLGGARRERVSVLLAPATGTEQGLRALHAVQPSLVKLEPLDDAGLTDLAHDVLCAAADETLLARLRQLSTGNAASAAWLLDRWQRTAAIEYVDRHAFLTEPNAVPTLPAWHPKLASVRALGPRAWLTAVALAVVGPLPATVAVPRLAALCGLTEDAVARCVDVLTTAQQTSQAGGVLAIPDELLRTSLSSYAGPVMRTRWRAMTPVGGEMPPVRDAMPPPAETPHRPVAPDPAVAYRRGEWDTVLYHARRIAAGIELHPRQRSAGNDPFASVDALAALIWVRRGRPDRAREWLARFEAVGDTSGEQRLAEAELALVCGEYRWAGQVMGEGPDEWATAGWAELVAHVSAYGVPEADGVIERGRQLVNDRWAARSTTDLSDDDRLWLMLARSRAVGDPVAAVDTMRLARRLGQPYALALSCLAAAEVGAPPGSTLGEAFDLLGGLRAIPAWCRAAAVARACRVRVPAAAVGPDGYDDVTRVLLALVAEGLPTRVIGRVLHLSDASVEVRLGRLYARSGYRSRAELAVAFRHGELTAAWL